MAPMIIILCLSSIIPSAMKATDEIQWQASEGMRVKVSYVDPPVR